MLTAPERRRIKEEEAERAAAGRPKRLLGSNSYGAIISTVALLISATTAYFANFYTKRSVLVAVNPPELEQANEPQKSSSKEPSSTSRVALNAVLSNDGNRTEVVLAVTFVATSMPCGGRNEAKPLGPFVLKSTDATVVPLEYDYPFDILHRDVNDDLAVKIVVLAPGGKTTTIELPAGNVHSYIDPQTKLHTGEARPSATFTGRFLGVLSLPEPALPSVPCPVPPGK
jgi:lipoprotein-anchoring transpeptidase ErfK/SrfK